MPFGGIERGEQAVSQATVRARELARQEQAQFMADYEAGRLNPTPFPNLVPITGAFDAARRAQAAPALSDAQIEACQVLLKEAAAAIRSAKAEDFGFALGPNLASCKRKYAEDTRALYWQYLSLLTQLAIAERREKILFDFASSNAKPENLSADQQSRLRGQLISAFNPESRQSRFIIPNEWSVNPEFSSLAQHEASSLFEQEHCKIQSERNITDLPAALRQIKQKSEKLKNKISALKARLDELAKADAVLMENDAQASWKLFRESYAGRRGLEQRIQTLKESGLPLVSLAELEDEQMTLFELAAQQYGTTQSPDRKAALQRIMDTLTSHGSEVASERALQGLDWQALIRVSPHAAALTPEVLAVRADLERLAKERYEEAASTVLSWLRRTFYSVAANKAHEAACHHLLFVLFSSASLEPTIQTQHVLAAARAEFEARTAANRFQLIAPKRSDSLMARPSVASQSLYAARGDQEMQPLRSDSAVSGPGYGT